MLLGAKQNFASDLPGKMKDRLMRFFRQALIGLTLLTLSVGILAYAGNLIKDALSERFAQEARVSHPR